MSQIIAIWQFGIGILLIYAMMNIINDIDERDGCPLFNDEDRKQRFEWMEVHTYYLFAWSGLCLVSDTILQILR